MAAMYPTWISPVQYLLSFMVSLGALRLYENEMTAF